MPSRDLQVLHEQLIDRFQVALPLVSRNKVMAAQLVKDADTALRVLEECTGLLRTFARTEQERERARRAAGDPS